MAFTPRWARAKRPRVVGPWATYLGRVLALNDAPQDPLTPFSDEEKRLIAQERYEFPMRYAVGVNQSLIVDALDELDLTPPSDGA